MAKFGPALAALVLAAVLGISSGSWCTKNIIQTYTTTITYINPCPYRGNYISQRRVTRTRLVTIRVCCDGWTGCYCSIPICRNGCGVNRKCVLPNTCVCSSRQFVPVAGNTQCSVAFCTTKDNCYPGTCMGSNQCTCSSGFGGPNCQTVLDTARYRKCLVTLEGIDYYGSPAASNVIDGECKEENIIVDISLKSGFSKLKRVERMRLDWEGYYHEPRDIPQYAPYISYSLPGIIYASTNLSNGATFPCFDKKLANNASLAVRCTESQPVNSAMPHNSRLNISLYTLIGGFKEYKAVDGLGTYERQEYTGQPASVVFDVTFDSEPPVHCFVAQQIQCESEDADTPDPEPIFAAIDATTDPKITFYWPGWYDEPSQIKDYAYSIWVLQYVNRSLVPYGPPDQRGLWDPTNDYPSVIVNQPCLISAVLNVTDYAGNTRRADTLVLYAPGSSLEADNSNPIKVLEAPDGGRWLNTLAAPTVSLSYDRHFINKVFEEYKLLAPVYQHPDIESMYRDNFGNITSVGLGPTEGLKYVNFTSEVIPATTTRKKRQTPQLASVSFLTGASLTSKLVVVPFNPSSDGDSVKVDLTVVDVMGNVVKETVRVGADSSPPLVDLQTARFEGNTRRKIDGLEHFTSSFIARAFDPHSGVTRAEWKASQPGNQVSGVYNIPPLEGPDCLALGQDCKCTPLGDCYNVNAEVLIDNCELAKLDNVPFDIEITFNNNASLASNSTTRKINPYSIDGPGKYPPVAEPFVSFKSPTEVEVKWRLPHACEKFSRIMIEYKQQSTTSQSQTLSSMAVNTTISGLHAQRESTVTITIVYTDGNEGKISHNFITPATVLAITGGQIAGVVIGLIVFIIILLIVLLLLLMWIYRTKTIEEKPSLLVSFEEKMETYGVLKVYRERIYRESPYYKAQLPNPYAKKVDDGVLYDEVKNYHDMSPPQGSSAKNYDISTIVLGSGSLFIVKRANLKDKAGSKAVAAKMLKEGKGEPGKIVLLAKINYMSRISKHQNLINYISSDKEVPIMFLELCGLGTLLDWVKNVKQPLSTEDNDKLLAFSQDITAGVKHLHDNNFVHRRLAAHNILLASGSDRPIAKITGFGPLSSDYDKQNKKIPARWMAPELLVTPPTGESRPYSTHSDMWSWGITLWELFSLGQKPYEDIPIDQLRRRVIEGERPSQPQYCADTMYEQLMKPCWQLNPNNRASVEHVYTRLDTFVNGSHTNDSYYPEGATHNLDDDCMLENEQNRDRYYSNNNPQQSYFDP